MNSRNIPTPFCCFDPKSPLFHLWRIHSAARFSPSFQTCRGNLIGPTIVFSSPRVCSWCSYHSSSSSFHFSFSPVSPSLWESVMDVCMLRVQMWEPSLESNRRLRYPGSLSSCRLLSSPLPPPLPFFLSPSPSRAPLAIQHREALRN